MTILRIGSNSKYAEGWDQAFGKGGKKAKPVAKASTKASAKKAAPAKKKAAPKKKAKK